MFFNILVAKISMAFSVILDGRGNLLGLADDCKILSPPDVISEVVHQLPALAISEG